MITEREAFNIYLLSNDKQRLAGLLPVDSLDIFNVNGEFSPRGLYSNEIFGSVGEDKRMLTHSFIDIRTTIMHPKILLELGKIKGLYEGIMSGKMYATWNSELKDFEKSTILDGETGYSFFLKYFLEIKFTRNDSDIRDLRIDLLEKYKDKCMYRYIVVIPAGLRDVEVDTHGHTTEPKLNTMYRKLLRAANTMPTVTVDREDPVFDTVRWSLQASFNEIYLFIQSILDKKTGFLQSKWASRNIHGGSRNVITAINPSPIDLESPKAITVKDTKVGLHQYLKATVDQSIFCVKNSVMKPVLDNILGDVPVVDKKTLNRMYIKPDQKDVDKWSTVASIEKLINGFGKLKYRHKPVYISGNYAALIYRDDTYYKVFYDISELPKELDKKNVRPITWAEMFYVAVYEQSVKNAAFVTRYPITSIDSIYPCKIQLQTTVKSDILIELDDIWQPNENRNPVCFPILDEDFYDSMSVQTSHLPGLVADHDGDKTSLVVITSKEAIEEINAYLNSYIAYVNPSGGLRYGFNNPISEMVMFNLTHNVLEKA